MKVEDRKPIYAKLPRLMPLAPVLGLNRWYEFELDPPKLTDASILSWGQRKSTVLNMMSAFEVGYTRQMVARVSADDVARFIELSGDNAPLHTDPAFAVRHGFRQPLVHGALLIALLSRLVGVEFPGANALLERIDLGFRKPCYAPCELVFAVKVRQVSEAVASLVLDVEISDASGTILATGKTWHKFLTGVHQ